MHLGTRSKDHHYFHYVLSQPGGTIKPRVGPQTPNFLHPLVIVVEKISRGRAARHSQHVEQFIKIKEDPVVTFSGSKIGDGVEGQEKMHPGTDCKTEEN